MGSAERKALAAEWNGAGLALAALAGHVAHPEAFAAASGALLVLASAPAQVEALRGSGLALLLEDALGLYGEGSPGHRNALGLLARLRPAGAATAGAPPPELAQLHAALRLVGPGTSAERQELGEALFPRVGVLLRDATLRRSGYSAVEAASRTGKVTGMLLELGRAEVLGLLQEPAVLREKVEEALRVAHGAGV